MHHDGMHSTSCKRSKPSHQGTMSHLPRSPSSPSRPTSHGTTGTTDPRARFVEIKKGEWMRMVCSVFLCLYLFYSFCILFYLRLFLCLVIFSAFLGEMCNSKWQDMGKAHRYLHRCCVAPCCAICHVSFPKPRLKSPRLGGARV